MYTIVKPQENVRPRPTTHQPQPLVIDHRRGDVKYQLEKTWVEDIPYKTLRHQRDSLLESEIAYKKRLKELEKEKQELLKFYEPTYEENKQLKSILQHGPDAVKMKQLKKAKRELETQLDDLKYDHMELSEQMKSLLNASNNETRDKTLESHWQTVLTGGSKNKLKRTRQKRTHRKHDSSVNILSIHHKTEDSNATENDNYDLQLDTVEKEIQILLNNVKQLKNDKKKVDYAVSVGKGAIVANPVLQNAINEKLENDLAKFKENVINAQTKSSELKEQIVKETDKETEKEFEKETEVHSEQQTKTPDKEEKTLDQRLRSSSQSGVPISKATFNTVETQTDSEFQRSNSDKSSNRLKLPKLKKCSNPVVQSRAIQTEFINLDSKVARERKPLNVTNEKAMASRQTVSKTQRRIEYADRLISNRGSLNGPRETQQDSQQNTSTQDVNTGTNNTVQSSNTQKTKIKSKKMVSEKTFTDVTTGTNNIVQSGNTQKTKIKSKKMVSEKTFTDKNTNQQDRQHNKSKQDVNTGKNKIIQTNSKPKAKSVEATKPVDSRTLESPSKKYSKKFVSERTFTGKDTNKQDRQHSTPKQDVNTSVNKIIPSSIKPKTVNMQKPKPTVAKTTEASKNNFNKKTPERSLSEIDTSKQRQQQGKPKARIKSKSVGQKAEPTESDEMHDKIMDKRFLPQLRSTGYTTPHDVQNDKHEYASPAFGDYRHQQEIDFRYRSVSRADTPINDIPDFDFIVPHKRGKIRFQGKPAIEKNKLDANEDAYDEVLTDLTNRKQQPETNKVRSDVAHIQRVD